MLPHAPVAARISRSPSQPVVVGCKFESYLGSQQKSTFQFCTLRATPIQRSNLLYVRGSTQHGSGLSSCYSEIDLAYFASLNATRLCAMQNMQDQSRIFC